MSNGSRVTRWTFGDYELDVTLFRLLRRGAPIPLQRKPLYLLRYLVQHAERVVPSDELTREIWRDVAVTDASLRRAIRVLRQTLGEGYIASARGHGYRFAARVQAHSSQPPVRTASTMAVPSLDAFVGRDNELAALEGALDRTLRGELSFVLVSGPPGMGKSRLAREFLESADARGVNTAIGYCWDGGGSPAFWPWGSLLQELALTEDAAELGAPLSPEAAPTRFRLFADIAASLRRACEQQPLMLVVEDVHWAEEPALSMCRFVVEQLHGSRLMIVCTCRDSGLTAEDPRAGLLVQLANRGKLLSLGPLDQVEVASLLSSSNSLAVDDKLAASVLRWTGGNPLFVRGLVPILLAQAGSLRAEAVRESGIPSGIREAIRAQLEPLTDLARQILCHAAVIGEDFALSMLREMGVGDASDVTQAIAQAVDHHVLQASGPGRYRFAHALFRETLYGSLGGAERMRLHQQAALALERLGFGDSDEHAGTIAHHFSNASPLAGAAERALHYTILAARAALARFAHEEARDRFLGAQNLLSTSPNAARQAEVLLGLGDAQFLCGAADDSKHTFLRVADLARSSRDALLLAEAGLGYGRAHFESGYVEQTLFELLQEALASLPKEDSTTRVMLLARLVAALQFDRDDIRRSRMGDEAVAMARRLGDGRALAHALSSAMFNCWHSADPAVRGQWLHVATEAVNAAQATGNLDLLANGRLIRRAALLERAELAELRQEHARFVELSEKIQNPMHLWFAQLTDAAFTILEGRLNEGEVLVRRVFEQGQRIQTPLAEQFFHAQSLNIARDRGTIASWLAPIDQGRFPHHFGVLRAASALAHHETGDLNAGLAEIDRLVAAGLATQLLDFNWPTILTMAADAAGLLNHRQAAAELYDLLLPHSTMVVCTGSILGMGGLVDHSLGVLALTLGNDDRASEHLLLARQIATKLGAPAWLARCDFALARACTRRGDQAGARAYRSAAERGARAVGMQGLLKSIAELV